MFGNVLKLMVVCLAIHKADAADADYCLPSSDGAKFDVNRISDIDLVSDVRAASDEVYRIFHDNSFNNVADLISSVSRISPDYLQRMIMFLQNALEAQQDEMQMELVRKWEAGEGQETLSPALSGISSGASLSREIDSLLSSESRDEVNVSDIKSLIKKHFGDEDDKFGLGFAIDEITRLAYGERANAGYEPSAALLKLVNGLQAGMK